MDSKNRVSLTAVVIGVLIVAGVLVFIYCVGGNRENLRAYHFGFPTHGSYNYGGGPLRGWPFGWGRYSYRGSPYGGAYGRLAGPNPSGWYYRHFVKPYMTGTCYSASKDEDCRAGYSKTRKDSDGDGDVDDDDEWLCCRDRDMF